MTLNHLTRTTPLLCLLASLSAASAALSAPGAPPSQSEIAFMTRICAHAQIHVDCYAPISPDASARTLAQYKARVDAWLPKGIATGATHGPDFWKLPLTFNDRIAAWQYTQVAADKVMSAPARTRPLNMRPMPTTFPVQNNTAANPMATILLLASSVFSLMVGVPAFIIALFISQRLKKPQIPDKLEQQLIDEGLFDRSKAWRDLMNRVNAERAKRLERALAFVFLVAVVAFLFMPLLAGATLLIGSIAVSGWSERPVKDARREWVLRYGVVTSQGVKHTPRFVSPPSEAPAPRGEHGIAHALDAAQAQAQGFAERDGPPLPGSPSARQTPVSSDDEVKAFLSSLSDAEFARFAEASDQEQFAIMRRHGIVTG